MSFTASRWFRRAGIALIVLLTAGTAAIVLALHQAEARMSRSVPLPAYPVALRDDAGSLARGRYLYESRGCADCHGLNGAGRLFVNDGGLHLAGPNISPGPGNVVANYQVQDWERVIRHGVKPDGRPAMIMPSDDYNRLTDDDLAALVGYVRSLPPVAGQGAVLDLPMGVRVLYGLGAIKDAAARIDHQLPPQAPVPEGVTVEHGRYVANMCIGCHGPTLSGGKIPGSPPSWPDATNLTPGEGSAMVRYASADAFVAMLHTAQRPDGSAISPVMPFEALGRLSDTDARALHAYLLTVPSRPAGGR
ncbi:c-type cytochrome [Aquabacterium sp.]|uniref:c-type cytochrome n=1 Tax=Aquabacterium sp. TaxID=1872578 RepID=UPI004037F2D8